MCITIPLLVGCSNFTQKNNTILFDDIQFTVLASGLIAIKTDSNQPDYFKSNTFSDFKVQQKESDNLANLF